jgi:acetyl-CoA acyltransferase 1
VTQNLKNRVNVNLL